MGATNIQLKKYGHTEIQNRRIIYVIETAKIFPYLM